MARVTATLLALGIGLGAAAAVERPLRLEGHGGPVTGVAVSPDGTRAATAGFDYSVGLWALGRPEAVPVWAEGHRAAVNAVAFHPDGRLLSVGDDFALMLWSAGGEALARLEGHRGKVVALALAPDGRTVATAGWDGRIGLWDLDKRRRLGWLEGHDGAVNDVAFAGSDRLYSAAADGTVMLWDVAARRALATPVSHGLGVNRLALRQGWLAYGTVDGTTRVIDRETATEIANLSAGRRPILALEPSPDGARIAVGDGEGHILVAETGDWTVTRDFRATTRGPVWALAWDGNARLLAAGLDDTAVFWPVGTDDGAGPLFAEAVQPFQRAPAEMSNGERQFVRKCSVCHTLQGDGARRAGPTLEGVFGRPAGGLEDYPYSPALAQTQIVWSAETIDRLFDEGPDHVTPGSKMPMQRIAGAQDRADLIAFLRANTTPQPESPR